MSDMYFVFIGLEEHAAVERRLLVDGGRLFREFIASERCDLAADSVVQSHVTGPRRGLDVWLVAEFPAHVRCPRDEWGFPLWRCREALMDALTDEARAGRVATLYWALTDLSTRPPLPADLLDKPTHHQAVRDAARTAGAAPDGDIRETMVSCGSSAAPPDFDALEPGKRYVFSGGLPSSGLPAHRSPSGKRRRNRR